MDAARRKTARRCYKKLEKLLQLASPPNTDRSIVFARWRQYVLTHGPCGISISCSRSGGSVPCDQHTDRQCDDNRSHLQHCSVPAMRPKLSEPIRSAVLIAGAECDKQTDRQIYDGTTRRIRKQRALSSIYIPFTDQYNVHVPSIHQMRAEVNKTTRTLYGPVVIF